MIDRPVGDELVPVADLEPASVAAGSRRLVLGRVAILVVGLVLWEFAVRIGVLDPLFVASPAQVVAGADELIADPDIQRVFLETVTIVVLAFSIGAGSAVLVGVWLGLVSRAYRTLLPFVSLAMSTPKIIFLPLVVVIFGIGDTSKVAYGSMSAFFFTIPSVAAAVRMIDPRLLLASRSLGATRSQRFWHLVVPGSLPGVVTGLWFGMKHALLSVLVAELFISQGGIGFWINRYTSSFQVDKVYALILGLSVIAIAIGWGFRSVEQRLSRWQGVEA